MPEVEGYTNCAYDSRPPTGQTKLMKAPFFSTGMDCFGPFTIKVGLSLLHLLLLLLLYYCYILFKCLTMHAVHVDLLSRLDTDSFLMALRRFIARRGKPVELLSDQGTNFKGGEKELQEAFQSLHPSLQAHLAIHQIKFQFNPPSAPHFGGIWGKK